MCRRLIESFVLHGNPKIEFVYASIRTQTTENLENYNALP